MAHRILIVDDSPLIRRSLRTCLELKDDWQVCGEAEDGLAAIEQVKELKPDVVILDLQMPVMNGLEAAREISRIAPYLPVLMFTLYSSEQLLQEAKAVGVRDVFSKSSGLIHHLLSGIQNVFESKKAFGASPSNTSAS